MIKYKLITELRRSDRLLNLFFRASERLKAYCGNCHSPVFNLNTKWAKEGLCIHCWSMRKEKK